MKPIFLTIYLTTLHCITLFLALCFFGFISITPPLPEAPPIEPEISLQDTLYKDFDTTLPKSMNN